MSAATAPADRRAARRLGEFLAPALICVCMIPLAAGLAEALYVAPPTWSIAVGGGLALATGVALVIARYELAASIGFLLTAVVVVEPAPSDGLFALIMIVAFVTGRFRVRGVPRTPMLLVFAFLALNVLSASSALSFSIVGRFFLITLYLGLFSVWLAAYIDRPERARRLVRAYAFAAVASAVLASLALFAPFPAHTVLIGDGERAKGLFKDPNVYGPFLIPIALIVAEEIFNPRLLSMRRSMRVLAFLALSVGVVFSYSRAAWLNLVLGLLVLVVAVVLRRPDRRAISLVLVVAFGALVTFAVVIATGSLGFLQERAKLQGYDTHRFAAQDLGLKVGLSHAFGVGPGQFDVVSPTSSHSLYVRSLAEQGVLGLVVIAALMLTTLGFALANLARGRDTHGISAAALLAAWVGLIANSFFVDTMHWRHLWLVAALIWVGAMRERGPRTVKRSVPAREVALGLAMPRLARSPGLRRSRSGRDR